MFPVQQAAWVMGNREVGKYSILKEYVFRLIGMIWEMPKKKIK